MLVLCSYATSHIYNQVYSWTRATSLLREIGPNDEKRVRLCSSPTTQIPLSISKVVQRHFVQSALIIQNGNFEFWRKTQTHAYHRLLGMKVFTFRMGASKLLRLGPKTLCFVPECVSLQSMIPNNDAKTAPPFCSSTEKQFPRVVISSLSPNALAQWQRFPSPKSQFISTTHRMEGSIYFVKRLTAVMPLFRPDYREIYILLLVYCCMYIYVVLISK